MILTDIKYTYNDLTIVPSMISNVKSRKECHPYVTDEFEDEHQMLPIFTAPMSTIVNEENADLFIKNGVYSILPRNIGASKGKHERYGAICDMLIVQKRFDWRKKSAPWIAMSLTEFDRIFVNDAYNLQAWMSGGEYHICIDLANGHMLSLYHSIEEAKNIAKTNGYTLVIMTGNIANPETYEFIAKNYDVDYIRVGIGSGNNCITTSNTGVHYPMASLVNDCYKVKAKLEETGAYFTLPKIVADGGIRNYSDVTKALALGADYVMIGSLFTALLESAAEVKGYSRCGGVEFHYSMDKFKYTTADIDKINCWDVSTSEDVKRRIIEQFNLTKESYGMSTKKAQKLIDPFGTEKTSEGVFKTVEVKYTLHQWVENMVSYLRSAMSYCNTRLLDDFIGKVNLVPNTPNAISVVNK